MASWFASNKVPMIGMALCASIIGACTSLFDGLKPGPQEADAQPIQHTKAWDRAISSGKVAEGLGHADDIGGFFLPPPFNQVVNGVSDRAEAYAVALHGKLEELRAQQAAGGHVTESDVYKAMLAAAGIGGFGAFIKRKAAP